MGICPHPQTGCELAACLTQSPHKREKKYNEWFGRAVCAVPPQLLAVCLALTSKTSPFIFQLRKSEVALSFERKNSIFSLNFFTYFKSLIYLAFPSSIELLCPLNTLELTNYLFCVLTGALLCGVTHLHGCTFSCQEAGSNVIVCSRVPEHSGFGLGDENSKWIARSINNLKIIWNYLYAGINSEYMRWVPANLFQLSSVIPKIFCMLCHAGAGCQQGGEGRGILWAYAPLCFQRNSSLLSSSSLFHMPQPSDSASASPQDRHHVTHSLRFTESEVEEENVKPHRVW